MGSCADGSKLRGFPCIIEFLECSCIADRYTFEYNLVDLEVNTMPATKTANVNARIDLSVKTQAESILSQLGLPRSVAIDAFYRQIIIHGGIPFSLNVPQSKVPSYDEMTQSEFNQMLATAVAQIKRGETVGMDEVFDEIEADWEK